MKPELLIVELWGLGDLAIATPFIRAASERFSVTVLAKPYATDLQERFWPGVKVIPFVAPWTAFKGKYRLYAWPWGRLFRFLTEIGGGRFDVGLSARWDPRDHVVLALAGAKRRLGFPRMGSRVFLTDPLESPEPTFHRYQSWRVLGWALGFDMPARDKVTVPEIDRSRREILIHTGAGQAVRVWPLDRYQRITERLRSRGYQVRVACDPDQRAWWVSAGEEEVMAPASVTELMALIDRAGAFIGNDSGPGHLAALSGVPTFTIFGPQLPEWFAPLHPRADWIEGEACPYKPCSDYCRWPEPHCLTLMTENTVWIRVKGFLVAHLDR